ncbi:MAG: hypothetical protein K9L30_16425 [Desulfobacterales bacterium]|nr:hypothetical protein [Desulfobacterales bacterium]
MAISINSNSKLTALQEAEFQLSKLLLTWKESEILTREILITYNHTGIRKKWISMKNQFDEEFKIFLETPITINYKRSDYSIQTKIGLAELRWQIIKNRMNETDKLLVEYLAISKKENVYGNFLVDFGEKLNRNDLNEELMDLLRALRWQTSISHFAFTEGLTDISDSLINKIHSQTRQVKFNSLILSLLILFITGLFIMLRMFDLNRSRLSNFKHSKELSAEITERKFIEDLMVKERDKLHTVVNAMGDFMYIVNNSYDIEYQNDALDRLHKGSKEYKCYKRYHGFDIPCKFCQAPIVFKKKTINQTEAVLADDKTFEIVFSPFWDVDFTSKVIVLKRDITKRKKYEDKAIRAFHLASIGELAASVAHEINNPIGGVINYAERMAEISQKHSIDDFDIPNKIIKESDRIARIVKNLLAYSRDEKGECEAVKVKSILDNALELYEKQLTSNGVVLHLDVDAGLPHVFIRSEEVQQVFLNILSNAKYALNLKFPLPCENKKLEIKMCSFKVGEIQYVRITFTDFGIGIPDDIKEMILNPFFSTKPKGMGTGLGLSISHSIIKSFDGRINFESETGQFTRVIIDFPAIGDQSKGYKEYV